MSLKRCDLFRRVVVVNPKVEVVRTTDNPVLASNKSTGSYRDICEFKGFDDRLNMIR